MNLRFVFPVGAFVCVVLALSHLFAVPNDVKVGLELGIAAVVLVIYPMTLHGMEKRLARLEASLRESGKAPA